jgi:hypothetical protein
MKYDIAAKAIINIAKFDFRRANPNPNTDTDTDTDIKINGIK